MPHWFPHWWASHNLLFVFKIKHVSLLLTCFSLNFLISTEPEIFLQLPNICPSKYDVTNKKITWQFYSDITIWSRWLNCQNKYLIWSKSSKQPISAVWHQSSNIWGIYHSIKNKPLQAQDQKHSHFASFPSLGFLLKKKRKRKTLIGVKHITELTYSTGKVKCPQHPSVHRCLAQ